jgi:hypothetical protein
MNKKNSFLGMLILCLAAAGVFIFSPTTGGQESQRGACEQACNKTYQECRMAPNANLATCKEAYDSCRLACKDVEPQPSPTPTVSPTATPTPTVSPTPTPSPTVTPTPSPSPTVERPASQRGQCEQECNTTYKSCKDAANADKAACKSAYKECRKNCKNVEPHPSPSPTPTPTPPGV